MQKFGYIALVRDEFRGAFNSVDEAREDARDIIEQLGGEAFILKFEVIEQLRDRGEE